jgi:DNA polymerase I-like protein with 3'-5' exonuclease and polymerase domains
MIDEDILEEEQDKAILPPKRITKNRHVGGRFCLAGVGNREADIMFVQTSVTEEEIAQTQTNLYTTITVKPKMGKSAAGAIFRDMLKRFQLDPKEDVFFTALTRWLLPKGQRSRPKKEDVNWGMVTLHNEIMEVKPKIVVCMGKPVFDALSEMKFNSKELQGAWVRSEKYNCLLYLVDDIYKLVTRPDNVEKLRIDMKEIQRTYNKLQGFDVPTIPTEYETISNQAELKSFVDRLEAENRTVLSVDCEWKGRNHVDGELRSFQICWSPGKAAYIRFTAPDDNGVSRYVFDCTYREAGAILGRYLNKPDVRYIGHHFAADAPWMLEWLGLDVFGKCDFDTEFGQQCVDEYQDLKLERIAMTYTDMGRYDWDLTLWKKENKIDEEDGYGTVPDEILIPYGCGDVDAVFRIYPCLLKQMLQQQGLYEYFIRIFLPFVTDVFINFSLVGLPLDIPRMDQLRTVYTYARDRINESLRKAIQEEAKNYLMVYLMGVDQLQGIRVFDDVCALVEEGRNDHAFSKVKAFVGPAKIKEVTDIWNHYIESPLFNIRSHPHMRRWLFGVKKLKPIKTTSNKAEGRPAMPWEKVEELPPALQKEYNPAVDKETIKMLGEQSGDPLLAQLLELNSVGNLCKAFLKEADIDPETGEVVKENGLHFWISADSRIHGQMSTTETARPRSWKPNSLNFPKFVNKYITKAIQRVIEEDKRNGCLPEFMEAFVGMDPKHFPSVRSCIMAPPGYCFVESDLDTAEVVGLAYIAGDHKMISCAKDPDPQFGITNDGDVVRLCYADDCGIQPHEQNASFCMAKVKKHPWVKALKPGDAEDEELGFKRIDAMCQESCNIFRTYDGYLELTPVDEKDLKRDADGNLIHPRHDLHWELTEEIMGKSREVLSKDVHRDGFGKVGNFQIAYGAVERSLERGVESAIGRRLEDAEKGMGKRMLDAYGRRAPIATRFLEDMEKVPESPGFWQAPSGRIRHFHMSLLASYGVGERTLKGIRSALSREARNFPMQNIVADTLGIASNGCLREFKELNMKARPLVVLYDAMLTLCPIKEREKVAELHHKWLHKEVFWDVDGGRLRFTIDTDYCTRWSTYLTEEEREELGTPPQFEDYPKGE